MKFKFVLIVLVCAITACKNNRLHKLKMPPVPSVVQLHFSKDNVTEIQSETPNNVGSFSLHKDEFLAIHFKLNKPLLESLQVLAPDLKSTELLEKGNFQFSFIVDGAVVYVENLDTGAGSDRSKTEALQHTIQMVTPKQIDYWGWFMWLKFMKLGDGQDALSTGNHSLTIEVRPYLQLDTLQVGSILATGNCSVNVAEIVVDEKLIPVQKIPPNSGWELSEDSYDISKIEAVNRKIAENRFENIKGIVVLKEGRLLIEEYFNGATRDSLHDTRSVGKSFASTLLGIAIEESYVKDENMLLKDFYDLKSYKNYSQKKDAVTLKSLLTMSSGFMGDDSDYSSLGNEENMYPTTNWVKFTLDLPMHPKKQIAKEYTYFTAGVVVLGAIIHHAVPKGLVTYADKKLFGPLDIVDYKWEYTPQNIGNTAGGLRMRAIDLAKYGQLYKNKGVWKGKRILTEHWVEKSLGRQIKQSKDREEYYGYLFWNKTFIVGDKKYEVSYCSGRGGNKVFVFKTIPLVVVLTSSAYNYPDAHANADKILEEYILPAVLP